MHAKEVVRERGLERIKLEELTKDITPKARALVPDSVKRELLVKIKDFLLQLHILRGCWIVHFLPTCLNGHFSEQFPVTRSLQLYGT